MGKVITPSEKKFAKLVASGLSKSEAVRRVYGPEGVGLVTTENGIRQRASKMGRTPHIERAIADYREGMVDEMDRVGLTPEFLVESLFTALKMAPADNIRWDHHIKLLQEANKLRDLYPKQNKELNARITFAKNLFNLDGGPTIQRPDIERSGGPALR